MACVIRLIAQKHRCGLFFLHESSLDPAKEAPACAPCMACVVGEAAVLGQFGMGFRVGVRARDIPVVGSLPNSQGNAEGAVALNPGVACEGPSLSISYNFLRKLRSRPFTYLLPASYLPPYDSSRNRFYRQQEVHYQNRYHLLPPTCICSCISLW